MQPKVLNIGSWNVRGLGNLDKRTAVFSMLEMRGGGSDLQAGDPLDKGYHNMSSKQEVSMSISLGVLFIFQRGECNGEKRSGFLLPADQYRGNG